MHSFTFMHIFTVVHALLLPLHNLDVLLLALLFTSFSLLSILLYIVYSYTVQCTLSELYCSVFNAAYCLHRFILLHKLSS